MQNESEPETMAGYWINRASRTIVRQMDARLRPLGFALGYLPVLRALAPGKPLSQKELARIARVEQPSMVETVARMERDGIVQRQPNPHDRRGSHISLTRKSRARFSKVRAALIEGEREAMDGLSDEEQALLRSLLQRVVSNVERLPAFAREGVACSDGPRARPAVDVDREGRTSRRLRSVGRDAVQVRRQADAGLEWDRRVRGARGARAVLAPIHVAWR